MVIIDTDNNNNNNNHHDNDDDDGDSTTTSREEFAAAPASRRDRVVWLLLLLLRRRHQEEQQERSFPLSRHPAPRDRSTSDTTYGSHDETAVKNAPFSSFSSFPSAYPMPSRSPDGPRHDGGRRQQGEVSLPPLSPPSWHRPGERNSFNRCLARPRRVSLPSPLRTPQPDGASASSGEFGSRKNKRSSSVREQEQREVAAATTAAAVPSILRCQRCLATNRFPAQQQTDKVGKRTINKQQQR